MTYQLVGVMAFGEADSAAGTVQAQFLTEEAQRIAGAEGQFDTVRARSDQVSPEELVTRINDAVPADLEVVTGEQAAAELADDVTEGFGFFRQILLVFGAIALLVATFIIYNTFSILVAQRSREMALLRAVGASRRQVLSSVLVEAVIVGFVAAVLGLLAGVALAFAVTAVLEGFGVELPSADLVIRPFTVGMALPGRRRRHDRWRQWRRRSGRRGSCRSPRSAMSRSTARAAPGCGSPSVLSRWRSRCSSCVPALGDDPTTDDLLSVGAGAVLLIARRRRARTDHRPAPRWR